MVGGEMEKERKERLCEISYHDLGFKHYMYREEGITYFI